MLVQVIKEALCILLALVCGGLAFRQMKPFHRWLFAQLTGWLFFYTLSYVVINYQKAHFLPKNNHWVFNLNILFETSFLSAAAYSYLKDQPGRHAVLICYSLFLLVFFSLISYNGWTVFSVYGNATESLVVIILYSLVLYNCVLLNISPDNRRTDIFITLGILLYFACNLPYFSLFNYLNRNHLQLSALLFSIITDLLANVRYLFLAIGFGLMLKNKPKQTVA